MHKITVDNGICTKTIYASQGEFLSHALLSGDILLEHPCGGKGSCRKCTVIINGEEALSCQYKVTGDIFVKIPSVYGIATASSGLETGQKTENMCLCLDLGTTTLVLALVSTDEKKIIKSITRNNPQRAFASDVMSRIDYCTKHGVELLHKKIIDEISSMTDYLFTAMGIDGVDTLYVAGNMTMLHLFFGISCISMGYAPYTPVFFKSKNVSGESLGIEHVNRIISLDGISAFVGADIVAGLGYIKEPSYGKYNLLIDLGTNAEIALYSSTALYSTAAAAGPCFEGVNISCGMSAQEGAVYSYSGGRFLTIGGGDPKGICATGLIDTIALLLEEDAIDETGFMSEGSFHIAKSVSLSQEDVRQFQLAKSAIHSAAVALIKKLKIDFSDIDKVYVSGGFSSKMNLANAFKVGLFPKEFQGKIERADNSCLLGLVKYACEKTDLSHLLENAEYIDLATDEYFQDLFIENMLF